MPYYSQEDCSEASGGCASFLAAEYWHQVGERRVAGRKAHRQRVKGHYWGGNVRAWKSKVMAGGGGAVFIFQTIESSWVFPGSRPEAQHQAGWLTAVGQAITLPAAADVAQSLLNSACTSQALPFSPPN